MSEAASISEAVSIIDSVLISEATSVTVSSGLALYPHLNKGFLNF